MKHVFGVVFLVCLALFLSQSAFSQGRNTGEIRGVVTDSSGAVLPGVTVTLTNVNTSEEKTFTTDSDGLYDTVSTPTGTYNVTFVKEGFKKLVRGPIVLQVNIITEDAALEVGTIQEEVKVVASGVPILETETGQQGTVLEGKTISQLPQIGAGITGNDWANFNILLPGATSAPSQPMSEGNGAYNAGDAITINGNLPNYANYLQDGAVVQLPVSNNVDNLVFSAVQEVQINTSSFSAQYGIGGAVFNQISKSGTNQYHGEAYEYWQNTVLNAAPYFEKSPGVAYPAAFLRYDEYGGNIGGPILRNRLFVFFDVDKIYNNGGASPQVNSVPTPAEAAECTAGAGCPFPGAYDFSAPGLPTLYDPATTTSNPALCASYGVTLSATQTSCRESFAQENTGALAGVNAIPAGRVDSVALKLLPYYPAPNVPGAGFTNNFTITNPAPNPNLRFFGRVDYTLSQSNHMSFSISQKNNPGVNKSQLPCPLNCFSGDIDGYNPQFTDTWTITPSLVNEFRMGYTRQGNWFIPFTLGFNPVTQLGLQYAKANVFPTINITSSAGSSCCTDLSPGTNAIYIENLYDPSDVVTLVKGKHVLHFGIEVLMGDGDTTPWGNVSAGTFGFTGQYTAQVGSTTTGAGLADFLLGDVQNWGANNALKSYARLKSPQAFVQDDWKIRPNLTVNLGLRYMGTTGFSEINNNVADFDPNLQLIYPCPTAQNPSCQYQGSLGSIWFAGQNNRTTLQKPDWTIFLPRVGFAWSFMPNTVLRGGFGMYAYNFSEDTYTLNSGGYGQMGLGAPTTSTGTYSDGAASSDIGSPFVLSSPASVADPFLNYVSGSRNPATYLNTSNPSGFGSFVYSPYNTSPARINEWSVSIEHQFGASIGAQLAYVGSHASNLEYVEDLNQITNPALLAGATTVVQGNRPFSAWGNLGGATYNGISNYNALQASLTKHFASGLSFQFNYVWSHMLDDQDSAGWGNRGGTQDWQINTPASNYGNSNFDVRNAFKGYVVYDLPFGNGQHFLNKGTLTNAVVGGWQVSGSILAQSGNPFTVTTNTNNTYSVLSGDGQTQYPNVTGSITGPRTTAEWFNTAAFSQPANGAFGDSGRNTLVGPRLTVVNLSVSKSVNFTERVHLQIQASFVNAFNHPSLANPGSALGGANFGEINSAVGGGFGAGVNVGPRQGQLGAIVSF